MTKNELVDAMGALAEAAAPEFPEIAACLFGLAGSVVLGGSMPRRSMDALTGLSREALQIIKEHEQVPS